MGILNESSTYYMTDTEKEYLKSLVLAIEEMKAPRVLVDYAINFAYCESPVNYSDEIRRYADELFKEIDNR